jgi:hypothetical protein
MLLSLYMSWCIYGLAVRALPAPEPTSRMSRDVLANAVRGTTALKGDAAGSILQNRRLAK